MNLGIILILGTLFYNIGIAIKNYRKRKFKVGDIIKPVGHDAYLEVEKINLFSTKYKCRRLNDYECFRTWNTHLPVKAGEIHFLHDYVQDLYELSTKKFTKLEKIMGGY